MNVKKIALITLASLLLGIGLLPSLLQISFIQNALVSSISKHLDTTTTIKSISFGWTTGIAIDQIMLRDRQGQNIFSADTILVTDPLIKLLCNNSFHMIVKEPKFTLYIDPTISKTNVDKSAVKTQQFSSIEQSLQVQKGKASEKDAILNKCFNYIPSQFNVELFNGSICFVHEGKQIEEISHINGNYKSIDECINASVQCTVDNKNAIVGTLEGKYTAKRNYKDRLDSAICMLFPKSESSISLNAKSLSLAPFDMLIHMLDKKRPKNILVDLFGPVLNCTGSFSSTSHDSRFMCKAQSEKLIIDSTFSMDENRFIAPCYVQCDYNLDSSLNNFFDYINLPYRIVSEAKAHVNIQKNEKEQYTMQCFLDKPIGISTGKSNIPAFKYIFDAKAAFDTTFDAYTAKCISSFSSSNSQQAQLIIESSKQKQEAAKHVARIESTSMQLLDTLFSTTFLEPLFGKSLNCTVEIDQPSHNEFNGKFSLVSPTTLSSASFALKNNTLAIPMLHIESTLDLTLLEKIYPAFSSLDISSKNRLNSFIKCTNISTLISNPTFENFAVENIVWTTKPIEQICIKDKLMVNLESSIFQGSKEQNETLKFTVQKDGCFDSKYPFFKREKEKVQSKSIGFITRKNKNWHIEASQYIHGQTCSLKIPAVSFMISQRGIEEIVALQEIQAACKFLKKDLLEYSAALNMDEDCIAEVSIMPLSFPDDHAVNALVHFETSLLGKKMFIKAPGTYHFDSKQGSIKCTVYEKDKKEYGTVHCSYIPNNLSINVEASDFPLDNFMQLRSIPIPYIGSKLNGTCSLQSNMCDITKFTSSFSTEFIHTKTQGAYSHIDKKIVLSTTQPAEIVLNIPKHVLNTKYKNRATFEDDVKISATMKKAEYTIHQHDTTLLNNLSCNLDFVLSRLSMKTPQKKYTIAETKGRLLLDTTTKSFSIDVKSDEKEDGDTTLFAQFVHPFLPKANSAPIESKAQEIIVLQNIPSELFDIWNGNSLSNFLSGPVTCTITKEQKDTQDCLYMCKIVSKRVQADATGSIKNSHFVLDKPCTIEIQIPKKSTSLQSGSFVERVYSLAPVKIVIDKKNFAFPFTDLSIKNLQLSGVCYSDELFIKSEILNSVLSLLKSAEKGSKELAMQVTPLYFSLENGKFTIKRVDMFAANTYHLALWGMCNLQKKQLEFVLGLTGKTLREALGNKDISDSAMLQIPIRGTFERPKIKRKRLIAKIAAYAIPKRKNKALKVLKEVLDTSSTIKEDVVPPPTTIPFPWEKKRSK